MKKWILPIIILSVLCLNYAFLTKFHYPELPFPNKTKHEVVNLALSSNVPLTRVTQQDGYVWFVTNDSADEAFSSLESRMLQNGWEFIEESKHGYSFERGNEKVVIRSLQWTRNYLLFQMPIGF